MVLAEIAVMLPVVGPVQSLTVFGAVGPLLASSTKFGGDSAEFQAESAVPIALSIILNEFKVNLKCLK